MGLEVFLFFWLQCMINVYQYDMIFCHGTISLDKILCHQEFLPSVSGLFWGLGDDLGDWSILSKHFQVSVKRK